MWLTSKMHRYGDKRIYIYESTHTIMVDDWSPFLWTMGRYIYIYISFSMSWAPMTWQHKEPGHQRSWYWSIHIRQPPHVKGQYLQLWLLKAHAHTHMTVQNKWSHWGPSIASQMIHQGSMSLQYNYNHVRWLWPSKNRSKIRPWHDNSIAMPSINLWPDIILFVEIFLFYNTTGTFLPYSTWVCMFQSSSIYARGLVLTHWCLL